MQQCSIFAASLLQATNVTVAGQGRPHQGWAVHPPPRHRRYLAVSQRQVCVDTMLYTGPAPTPNTATHHSTPAPRWRLPGLCLHCMPSPHQPQSQGQSARPGGKAPAWLVSSAKATVVVSPQFEETP